MPRSRPALASRDPTGPLPWSHTYGGLVYLPNLDRVFKFGGSYYRSGHAYDNHVYLYDVENRTWARRLPPPGAS